MMPAESTGAALHFPEIAFRVFGGGEAPRNTTKECTVPVVRGFTQTFPLKSFPNGLRNTTFGVLMAYGAKSPPSISTETADLWCRSAGKVQVQSFPKAVVTAPPTPRLASLKFIQSCTAEFVLDHSPFHIDGIFRDSSTTIQRILYIVLNPTEPVITSELTIAPGHHLKQFRLPNAGAMHDVHLSPDETLESFTSHHRRYWWGPVPTDGGGPCRPPPDGIQLYRAVCTVATLNLCDKVQLLSVAPHIPHVPAPNIDAANDCHTWIRQQNLTSVVDGPTELAYSVMQSMMGL